jgi:hypothetical protein
MPYPAYGKVVEHHLLPNPGGGGAINSAHLSVGKRPYFIRLY